MLDGGFLPLRDVCYFTRQKILWSFFFFFVCDNDRSLIPDLWAEESVIICWECHVWVFTWMQSSIPLMQLFLIYCLRYCKNPESHYHHRIARRSFTALFKAAVYIFLAQNFFKNIIHNKVYVISVGGGVSWGEGYGLSVFFIKKILKIHSGSRAFYNFQTASLMTVYDLELVISWPDHISEWNRLRDSRRRRNIVKNLTTDLVG